MKTLRFFLFSIITLSIISNAQTVIPPGNVSGTWALGGSPYKIQGDITIPGLDILTIEPGVIVEFQGHYKLNVQGRLSAIGTENDTITFTINDTTGFHNPNFPDGGWGGIRFINVFSLIDSSSLVFCKIEYGKAIGFWPDNGGGAVCVDGFDALTISNCLILNNIAGGVDWPGGGGISLGYSNPIISNNTISNNSAQFGGGILCYESSPLIKDNLFSNNSAQQGGGIYCNEYSNPNILNTIIEYNTANQGGGIWCTKSSPLIENNLLSNNSAQQGGGIICNEYSNPNILNTTIENNTAEAGGGIVCWNNSSPILNNTVLINNSATWTGGGISTYNSNLQIDNCTFEENNSAVLGGAVYYDCGDTLNITYQLYMTNTLFNNNSGVVGGGLWAVCSDSAKVDVFINKCSFTNNFAGLCSGLLLTGGLNKVNFTLSNSIFSANEALEFAAGCDFSECSGTVSNCLFNSNVAAAGGGNFGGGGLSVWSNSNVDIMNCTFADNTAAYGAGLAVGMGSIVTTTNCIFWGNNTDQIVLDDTISVLGSALTVNYCDIRGGEDSVNVIDPLLSTLNWGIGNIDNNPLFVNVGNSDYHLQNTSPCIGAAIDTVEINGVMCFCPPFDIEGNPRPYPQGSMPDIGAYESPLGIPVGVDDNTALILNDYSLRQNYPNPFNPITIIKYQVRELSFVTVKVYDILGNEIETLVKDETVAGVYELSWNAAKLPSGVYFYQLRAGNASTGSGQVFVETKKMILLK